MLVVIVCAFFLYWWILKNIQTIDAPTPDPLTDNGEQIDIDDDSDGLIAEDETELSEPVIDMEALARRREGLEQAKQEHRNQRDRLLRRLDDMASSLDAAKSHEKEMLGVWTSLNEQDAGFTETIAGDFVAVRERRSSLSENAVALSERHSLLTRLVENVGGEDVGASLSQLAACIDETELRVDEYGRECEEIARQAQRLFERSKGNDRGEPLRDILSRMETSTVSPNLEQLTAARRSEIGDECDDYFDEMVTETRREAQARSQQRRMENEEAARAIRQKAEDALAAHEAEQQRLNAVVEEKQRAFAFKRDRAKIEHYMVPFIAIKRTYTTPSLLDGRVREFHWANIPLEHAVSLSQIEATGVFDGSDDSFQELGYLTRLRTRDELGEQYLLYGQPWSYQNEGYMMLVREILRKHGQAMVEAELLRP